jgi:undecaprenyl-diphosphatase
VGGAIRDITAFGSAVVVAFVSLSAIGMALLNGRRRLALFFLIGSAGGFLLNSGLKELYDRPRPALPESIRASHHSFPSGHAMLSMSVYLSLAMVLATRARTRAVQAYVLSLAVLLAGLVGLSRVYLGHHYPTDVLAGWLAGVAWATLCGLGAWAFGRRE